MALGRPLSDEDVREIRANLAGFFDVLAGWQRMAGGANGSGANGSEATGPGGDG